MKIVLAGGGSGGHFYPLIAVAEEINEMVQERKLVEAELFYLADRPYDRRDLFENRIAFRRITAGKLRRYFSLFNFFDAVKTWFGILLSLWQIYWIYPDVVFSKGGYVSFPILMAARIFRIPVIIHESDSRPGRVNLWSAKFAARVAIAFPEAMPSFPKEKTALVGNPLRKEVMYPISRGAHEFLQLEKDRPVIFVAGGSQGAAALNETLLDILPQLLERYQVIHQTGKVHFADTEKRARFVLEEDSLKGRYKIFPFLNPTALRMTAGVTDLVVSRAGAGVIFEIAQWGLPAILIPIPESISNDQRENAFTYARSGGAVVIEQENLTASVLFSEIDRLMSRPELLAKMREGAKKFAKPEAGRLVAEEIIKIALGHE